VHGLAAYGVAWSRLTHVAVSHFHTDHVGDLAGLLFTLEYGLRPRRAEPLTLVGPVGLGAFVDRLAVAFGAYVREPSFGLEVVELGGVGGSGPLALAGGLALRAHRTPHTETSLAYRIEGPWGALGYTGDTGPSNEVADFLTGCRVLVAECAFDDPPETELHLSPALLAEMAHRARPELLVVTHVYPPLAPSEAVQRVSERYPGRVVAGADGVRIRLGARGADVDPPGGAVYT
jgi:ribonuclease BN (tRNA processing enzyme)